MKRALVILSTFLIAAAALAEPQYSALFGQSCFLCHTNPTGRGQRSLYGSQFFGPNYLPVRPVKMELLEKISPRLSESVLIGADLRTIWLSENTQDQNSEAGLSAPLSTNTGKLAQMEGNIYLTLEPSDYFLIYYSQGVAQYSGRFEAYGLVQGLPLYSFIKAGQFQEDYGWVFADHTSFVRTGLFSGYDGTYVGIPTPPHYGTGAEIGFRPWKFDISASFTGAQSNIPDARDSQKRWVARASIKQGVEKLGLQFMGGGSYYSAPSKAADPEYPFLSPALSKNEMWGGFGSVGWQGMEGKMGCKSGFGFLATSLMFEYDRKDWIHPVNVNPGAVVSSYSTTALSVQVQPGIWILGQYDWLDNGIPGIQDPEAERTTLGVQVFPLPWVEISPRYRLYNTAGFASRNQQQFELQFHCFF